MKFEFDESTSTISIWESDDCCFLDKPDLKIHFEWSAGCTCGYAGYMVAIQEKIGGLEILWQDVDDPQQ